MNRALTLTVTLSMLAPVASAVAQTVADATSPASVLTAERGGQPDLHRSPSDSYWYGQFGYGTLRGDRTYGGLAFAFGRRMVRHALGIDLTLFQVQLPSFQSGPSSMSYGGSNYTYALTGSLLNLKALYFLRPRAHATGYLGGGFGLGGSRFGNGGDSYTDWHGRGLQGDLTIGYDLARANTSTRVFVQLDAVRPFYDVTAATSSRSGLRIERRSAPSLLVSIGVGW